MLNHRRFGCLSKVKFTIVQKRYVSLKKLLKIQKWGKERMLQKYTWIMEKGLWNIYPHSKPEILVFPTGIKFNYNSIKSKNNCPVMCFKLTQWHLTLFSYLLQDPPDLHSSQKYKQACQISLNLLTFGQLPAQKAKEEKNLLQKEVEND